MHTKKNMRLWVVRCAVALSLLAASAFAAEELGPDGKPLKPKLSLPAGSRIGVVDVDRVTRQSKLFRLRLQEVEAQLETLTRQVEADRQKLGEWRTDLARKRSLLSEADIARREEEIRALEEAVEDGKTKAQRQARRAEADVIGPMIERLAQATGELGDERGVDVILRADLVLWSSPTVDLTDQLIAVLDADLNTSSTLAASPGSVAAAVITPTPTPKPTEAPLRISATPTPTPRATAKPVAPRATAKPTPKATARPR